MVTVQIVRVYIQAISIEYDKGKVDFLSGDSNITTLLTLKTRTSVFSSHGPNLIVKLCS